MVGAGGSPGEGRHRNVSRRSSLSGAEAPGNEVRDGKQWTAGVPGNHTEMREILSFLTLKEISGLGDRGIWKLVQRFGSGEAALRAARGQGELWGPDETRIRRSSRSASMVPSRKTREESASPISSSGPLRQEATTLEDVRGWMEDGMGIRPVTSPSFPPALLELTDPPPLVFFRGSESLLSRPGVAVVGARKATETGRRLARALGRVLAGAGIPVVSGMARGIDGAAHRGALEGGGDTVAVLGSGLQVVYPPAHRSLFHEIAGKGLLISEFLPREPSLPHHFPRRNRIIAALARAVVVVEAGARSGALITVDHALDLGRDVLAFPGSVESPQARGTNRILRDGARLLTHPEAILDELPCLVGEGSARNDEGIVKANPGLDLPSELLPLWTVLENEPRDLETLAREARLSTREAVAGLTILELMGRAQRCPGMRFRRG